MKKEKLKKYSIRVGVVFFVIVMLLTYFSNTIDNMLLPKVKVASIIKGSILDRDSNLNDNTFLIPISALSGFGDSACVYQLNNNEKGYEVWCVNVDVLAQNEFYYEVVSSELHDGDQIVYSSSKSITDGDKVYLEE